MADLFISYSKHDRGQALELADELRGRGFSVWIDQGGIEGAQNWSSQIVQGINGCSTLLLLISANSVASLNVAKEVHLAFEKRKNILPIVIEKVPIPESFEYSLAGLQRVQYHDRTAIFRALDLLQSGTVAGTDQLPTLNTRALDDTFIRVAVMPFDDLSPQHDNQWFADGIMDELIATLVRLNNVKIPSRSDVLHYREHRVKSRDIARELGVRYLIEGAVRKAGEKIRINASLIDTQNTEQLWANQFNGSFYDVFAIQESVSKSVAQALSLQLAPKEIEMHPTQNMEAYELYLKGRHEQYYQTKESYLHALDLYEQAATLDPKFVQVHIGIASVCSVYYREYSKNPKWLKRAEQSLAAAETITGETSRTLYIRGMIEWQSGNSQAAIVTLTRSVELDTKNGNSFNVLGAIYLAQRNYPAAAEAFQRATEITERTMDYFNLLNVLNAGGETERQIEVAQKALPVFERYILREPNDQNAAMSYAFVLLWANKREEAAEAASKLLARNNLSGKALFDLSWLFDALEMPEIYITLLRKSIHYGYRDIESIKNQMLRNQNTAYTGELLSIVQELDSIIKTENTTEQVIIG